MSMESKPDLASIVKNPHIYSVVNMLNLSMCPICFTFKLLRAQIASHRLILFYMSLGGKFDPQSTQHQTTSHDNLPLVEI